MTRTEFYTGVKFSFRKESKNEQFEFVLDKSNASIGLIKEYGSFHCVVSKATKTYIYYFTFIMGKEVKGKIAYTKLFSKNDKNNLAMTLK